ncbi:MAG TPA: hypothetical protein VMF90_06735 [Rhizobiaceae bacterium]|nr:hypothetical protein [Rhizobiaceae bacterium]
MTETVDAEPRPKPRRREAVKAFLVADRTPMWFSVALLSLGALGTYYLAPVVNAQFEAQKIKSDFVIRNYSDLRTKMEDFQGLFALVAQKQAAGEPVQAEVFRMQELIGRVGAQNLSLLPMFTTEGGPKAAAEVNAAMNGMINVIFAHAGQAIDTEEKRAAYNAAIVKASAELARPLLELYVRIGDVGRLNPTEKDTDLPDQ